MMLPYWALAAINENNLNIPKAKLVPGTITTAMQIAFGFAGAIALLMVTLAALRYVASQGNPQETAKAKNTIMYSIIGLIVCIMALAIVTFVVDKL